MGRATNSAVQANANRPKSMPYEGNVMMNCFIRPSDFKHTCAVIVSGVPGNFCGHALLHLGGWYFHTTGYQRYLKENDKREIRRWVVPIPNPLGAYEKLEELLLKQWLWLVLPHNCVNFVEEVVQAGGSNAGMIFNCPLIEPFI